MSTCRCTPFVILALLIASAAAAFGQPERTTARPADVFVESIGVNIHMNYADTAYAHYEQWKPLLLDLGIRHVRDGLFPDSRYQPYYDRHAELAEAGVHGTFIVHLGTDIDRVIPTARRLPNLIAFEGTNEPDIFHKDRDDWPGDTRRLQRQLYETVRNDPDYADTPVLAPSLVHEASFEAVGDLSQYADFGNIHPYPGGRKPTLRVDDESDLARKVSADLPIQATETGYQSALPTESGHNPASERAISLYLPRLFFEYFNRGIVRTFDYELLSTFNRGYKDIESNFGLLHYEPDVGEFRTTRQYHAIRRLIALLEDEGEAFEPSSLRFKLDHEADTLDHTLLQKRDGRFYLVLWLDESVWNIGDRRDLYPDAEPVTLTLPDGMVEANIYRPSRQSEPVETIENPRRIDLDVPAELLIVELVPE